MTWWPCQLCVGNAYTLRVHASLVTFGFLMFSGNIERDQWQQMS